MFINIISELDQREKHNPKINCSTRSTNDNVIYHIIIQRDAKLRFEVDDLTLSRSFGYGKRYQGNGCEMNLVMFITTIIEINQNGVVVRGFVQAYDVDW
jgi:hypothetical protein